MNKSQPGEIRKKDKMNKSRAWGIPGHESHKLFKSKNDIIRGLL